MTPEFTSADIRFMAEAIALAKQAAALGEVPIGCVITKDGEIVGRGYNRRETGKTALGHAELMAIEDACRNLGGWRLWQCRLYVTLEPCPMCAGAIINARIPVVVYGAKDPKAGSVGSITDLFSMPYNHHPQVISGVMETECAGLLRDFFRSLRIRKKSGETPANIDKSVNLLCGFYRFYGNISQDIEIKRRSRSSPRIIGATPMRTMLHDGRICSPNGPKRS